MTPLRKMKLANAKASQTVTRRGNVPKTLQPKNDCLPVPTWLMAVIIFVVCGSGLFQLFETVWHR